jgi:hypothetical protein
MDPTKWKFDPEHIAEQSGVLEKPEAHVICSHCKTKHPTSSEDFFAVYGNITRGLGGGMVGNNIDHNRVKRVSIYCFGCFCGYLCEEE